MLSDLIIGGVLYAVLGWILYRVVIDVWHVLIKRDW